MRRPVDRSLSVLAVTAAALLWMLPEALRAQGDVYDLPMDRKLALGRPYHTTQSERFDPFTIVGNVHYVGAKNIASYLITTPAGHILIDSGVSEMVEDVLANIERLGFATTDVEILLSSHAHFDHVQGHEAIRRATGARVFAMEGDAEALRSGRDLSPLGFEGWAPVPVERVLEHGDVVELGGQRLTAHHIPGHTPGCTVWTTDVVDGDETHAVTFFGCSGPNQGVRVTGNPRFPRLAEDTLMGYARLRAIRPDIYLNGHPEQLFTERLAAMRENARPHPLRTQQPWADFISELEQSFRKRVAAESPRSSEAGAR
jgi:metallo-beta-lactamase class B